MLPVARGLRQSALPVDSKRYGRLLARKLPVVIRTGEEKRLVAEVQDLGKRYDKLTPEERKYAELPGVLIRSV